MKKIEQVILALVILNIAVYFYNNNKIVKTTMDIPQTIYRQYEEQPPVTAVPAPRIMYVPMTKQISYDPLTKFLNGDDRPKFEDKADFADAAEFVTQRTITANNGIPINPIYFNGESAKQY